MKKSVFIGIITILVLSGIALTGCNSESNPQDATISQAKGLRDGTYVRITGEIYQIFTERSFRFKDSTGDITVEIDTELWGRAGRKPPVEADLPLNIEIVGEVDKEKGADTIIEAEFIKILN